MLRYYFRFAFVFIAALLLLFSTVNFKGEKEAGLSLNNLPAACTGGAGFEVLRLRDLSRSSFDSEPGRPMQIAVWYPTANVRKGRAVRFQDLVELSATETRFDQTDSSARDASVRSLVNGAVEHGASIGQVNQLLKRPTAAYWNAQPASGRFPVVLFVHSNPVGEHVMAEQLARCGFVVGAIVSKGTVEREYRLSVPNIETMVTDTAFVLGSLRNRPFADRRQAGIIGMSNGAFAAVLMHLRNPEISAIVSLDGTIGEQAAARVLPKDPYFDASNVRAALLHLYATQNPYLTLDTISSFVNAERMLAAMPKMRHSDFLSYGLYERSVPGISGVPSVDNSAGFDWVCRLTLHFLRAQLLQDQESRKFLKNAVNQNPARDWISSITLQLP